MKRGDLVRNGDLKGTITFISELDGWVIAIDETPSNYGVSIFYDIRNPKDKSWKYSSPEQAGWKIDQQQSMMFSSQGDAEFAFINGLISNETKEALLKALDQSNKS